MDFFTASAVLARWGILAAIQALPLELREEERPQVERALGAFIENRGQWDEGVRFHARGEAVGLTLTADALVFADQANALTLRLPGTASALEGLEPEGARFHYFLGANSGSGAAGYGRVRYREVAAGVDLLVRPDGSSFAYDLILAPGADLEDLWIGVEGANSLVLAEEGEAMDLGIADRSIRQRIGACWQEDPETGEREALEVIFRLCEQRPGHFAFSAPDWDPSLSLVIDPTLLFATYLGTSQPELPVDLALDTAGNVYVVGRTAFLMPTTPGSAFPDAPAGIPVWVGKLSQHGSTLEWATFLGGSDTTFVTGIAVDSDGSVVVAGTTWAVDFPVNQGAFKIEHTGLTCAFVSRLAPAGDTLISSTFLGGDGQEETQAMALAPNGDVVLGIRSTSTDFPATPGAFDTVKDPQDKMIARISADGTELLFATWFPIGRILGLAVDAQSNVYMAGETLPTTGPVPVTPGAFQTEPAGLSDGVVAKFDPLGSQVLWCTYLTGNKADTPWDIAVDRTGAVLVVGQTISDDFPTTPGAFATTKFPSGNGFATKLLPNGSGLAWSTYIGGAGGGGGYLSKAAVDPSGNLIASGSQNQPGWPTTPDALFPSYIGAFPSGDVVLTKFDALGRALVYSTFLGGTGTDNTASLALDRNGRPHTLFLTTSWDLPVTPGAYQSAYPGTTSMALAAFDLPLMPWRRVDTASKQAAFVPDLAATGALTPGSETRFAVRGGKPGGVAWLVVGASAWNLPLPDYGFTLHPALDLLVPIAIDPQGGWDLEIPWPSGGANLFFQVIGVDPSAANLIYASNGLRTAL